MIPYLEKPEGITFEVKVQPGAPRTRILGQHDRVLKLALAAPPVEGKANAECIRFLAKFFDLSRSQVDILTGETTRNKVILLRGFSAQAFEAKLNELEN